MVLLGMIAGLMMVNGAIRWLGGDPHLLSPKRMSDKLAALGHYVTHLPGHVFDACGDPLQPILQKAAKKHGLPSEFLIAVARTESAFRSHVVSRTGAMGVMQLMPETARSMGVSDPFDPEDNIDGGARYLGKLWKRYRGDRKRVAAAYNAGPGRVPKKGRMRLPDETRRYVKAVIRRSRRGS